MKSIIGITTLLIAVFVQTTLIAQTYSLSTYQAEYNSVGVGFPLTEGVWDDPGFVVPLGYSFSLFDDQITNLESLEEYTVGGSMVAFIEGNIASILGVYDPDIIDRGYHIDQSMSAIYFAYSGTPGQRVYTQEWLNVGFANGDTVNGVYTDFINFQLQLHEASRDIIFHFGSSSITNPLANYAGNSGPAVGLVKEWDITGLGVPAEVMLLTGNPLNPTIVTEFVQVYLNGSIPENTVYRFSQGGTSLEDERHRKPLSTFYPNPTSGELWIREGFEDKIAYPIQLYTAQGMLAKEIYNDSQLSTDDLPHGIYQVRFKTDEGWNAERIVVMN